MIDAGMKRAERYLKYGLQAVLSFDSDGEIECEQETETSEMILIMDSWSKNEKLAHLTD
jgi:hypothetical protein